MRPFVDSVAFSVILVRQTPCPAPSVLFLRLFASAGLVEENRLRLLFARDFVFDLKLLRKIRNLLPSSVQFHLKTKLSLEICALK